MKARMKICWKILVFEGGELGWGTSIMVEALTTKV